MKELTDNQYFRFALIVITIIVAGLMGKDVIERSLWFLVIMQIHSFMFHSKGQGAKSKVIT